MWVLTSFTGFSEHFYLVNLAAVPSNISLLSSSGALYFIQFSFCCTKSIKWSVDKHFVVYGLVSVGDGYSQGSSRQTRPQRDCWGLLGTDLTDHFLQPPPQRVTFSSEPHRKFIIIVPCRAGLSNFRESKLLPPLLELLF